MGYVIVKTVQLISCVIVLKSHYYAKPPQMTIGALIVKREKPRLKSYRR